MAVRLDPGSCFDVSRFPGLRCDIGGGFRAKVRRFPGGQVEVTWGPARGSIRVDSEAGELTLLQARQMWLARISAEASVPEGESERRAAANRDRSKRRARAQVRRKVLCLGADHLLTLTYRGLVVERTQAVSDLQKFVRALRDEFGQFAYVAVAELQARGSIHWHLAVKGRQNVNLLRRVWRGIVGHDGGNIDVQAARGQGAEGRARLAGYLAKYLCKGEENVERQVGREGKEKRYFASQGLEALAAVETFDVARNPMVCGLPEFAMLERLEVGGVWADGACGWAAFWDLAGKG